MNPTVANNTSTKPQLTIWSLVQGLLVWKHQYAITKLLWHHYFAGMNMNKFLVQGGWMNLLSPKLKKVIADRSAATSFVRISALLVLKGNIVNTLLALNLGYDIMIMGKRANWPCHIILIYVEDWWETSTVYMLSLSIVIEASSLHAMCVVAPVLLLHMFKPTCACTYVKCNEHFNF